MAGWLSSSERGCRNVDGDQRDDDLLRDARSEPPSCSDIGPEHFFRCALKDYREPTRLIRPMPLLSLCIVKRPRISTSTPSAFLATGCHTSLEDCLAHANRIAIFPTIGEILPAFHDAWARHLGFAFIGLDFNLVRARLHRVHNHSRSEVMGVTGSVCKSAVGTANQDHKSQSKEYLLHRFPIRKRSTAGAPG